MPSGNNNQVAPAVAVDLLADLWVLELAVASLAGDAAGLGRVVVLPARVGGPADVNLEDLLLGRFAPHYSGVDLASDRVGLTGRNES